MSSERRAVSLSQSLFDLRARGMVGHLGIVAPEIVVEHTSVLAHEGDTQLLVVETFHESRQCIVNRLPLTLYLLMYLCIEALQPRFQQPYLVLFLPCLLKDDKRHGKSQEERKNRQIELIADRDSFHLTKISIHEIISLLGDALSQATFP